MQAGSAGKAPWLAPKALTSCARLVALVRLARAAVVVVLAVGLTQQERYEQLPQRGQHHSAWTSNRNSRHKHKHKYKYKCKCKYKYKH